MKTGLPGKDPGHPGWEAALLGSNCPGDASIWVLSPQHKSEPSVSGPATQLHKEQSTLTDLLCFSVCGHWDAEDTDGVTFGSSLPRETVSMRIDIQVQNMDLSEKREPEVQSSQVTPQGEGAQRRTLREGWNPHRWRGALWHFRQGE